ncbi:protein-L-isoaspartate O-methyltransferase [Cohnella kolymensis]|uniref:Protein-L-isoaspartate O-methyltransferase n=1 Tax=Cohnella kolymensis TaxID=1590652 RepID=A0ABR5A671_9BACL|nr:erythromycin esterase family protein [Cohnella kolymensis]KIL36554.1 protein-L-isoaspartate O-methyltransferase [Cohnella kolymensis]
MNSGNIVAEIRKRAVRLSSDDDLDTIIQAVGDADYVLLGEASHGTSEFYTIRAELSKRLIREKGFSFIAVEGDWPSCYTLNRYIKHYPDSADNVRDALLDFNRWPTWMWANLEIMDFAEWLYEHNQDRADGRQVGFYGLDVYSLWESMSEIVKHLENTGSPELETAKKAFSCFEPYSRDPQTYGVSAAFLSESCEDEVVKLLTELQTKRKRADQDSEAALSDELNALVAVNAERYYRAMVRGGPESWNIRDRHMGEALNRITTFHGTGAKAIVWEHNTHIGDARATDMAADGMVNVGQLVREEQGAHRVFAVGFGTHRGTVIAATEWGGEIREMPVPEAVSDSWEDLLHREGAHDKILVFDRKSDEFLDTLGHRAIGVVYHPQYERGNYVPSIPAMRYDAFVYVDESKALAPLRQAVLHV